LRRRGYVLLLTAAMLFLFALPATAAQVFVDGDQLDVSTATEDGTTLVPLRAIFQALGAGVNWDGANQTVTAAKDGTRVQLQIGQNTAYKNDKPVSLAVPGKIIQGSTMVPLRFVSESMGASVDWDGATQTITITSTAQTPTGPVTTQTTVHYIDVGQGDAIYIELDGNNDILIDAGDNGYGNTVVNYLKSKDVDDIEILIATHPHADHIGGLPAVFNAYDVQTVIDSGVAHTSQTYERYWTAVKAEGAKNQEAEGQAWNFGSCSFEVLGPTNTYQNLNDNSVVTKLSCPGASFMFTGDAEAEAESAILNNNLNADILKVGHHGSKTSTSDSFLSSVSPETAVICVGEGNRYEHPADETLRYLQNVGVEIYRTDLNGNIMVTSSGNGYDVNVNKQGVAPQPGPAPLPEPEPEPKQAVSTEGKYVGSSESDKYHYPDCRYAESISTENLIGFEDADDATAQGYVPCGVCKP